MTILGNNMSVLGSQLEIDLDPDGEMTVVPRHVGNTGTGCYKLHDHTIRDTKKMYNVPVSEKVEATYMYAPTPPPPPEPEPEEEADQEDQDSEDGKKEATSQGQATPSRSNNSSIKTRQQQPPNNSGNSHGAPHLLDTSLPPADQTPALASSTSIGVRTLS